MYKKIKKNKPHRSKSHDSEAAVPDFRKYICLWKINLHVSDETGSEGRSTLMVDGWKMALPHQILDQHTTREMDSGARRCPRVLASCVSVCTWSTVHVNLVKLLIRSRMMSCHSPLLDQ